MTSRRRMTFEEALKTKYKYLLTTGRISAEFALNLDHNLSTCLQYQQELDEFITANQDHFNNLYGKDQTKGIAAEKAVLPKYNTLSELISQSAFQHLYAFTFLIENGVTKLAQINQQTGENIITHKNAKNELMTIGPKSTEYQFHWIRIFNAASNYSRHFGEWSVIFREIRQLYLGPSYRPAWEEVIYTFDRAKFADVLTALEPTNKQSISSIRILTASDEAANELIKSESINPNTIVKAFTLDDLSLVRKRADIWLCRVEQLWADKYNTWLDAAPGRRAAMVSSALPIP